MADINAAESGTETPLNRALRLQEMLVYFIEQTPLDQEEYSALRSKFITEKTLTLLPNIIRNCRDKGQLNNYLSNIAHGTGAWGKRKSRVYEEFSPFLEHLEHEETSPSDPTISKILHSFDPEGVHAVWEKALSRRHTDPDGAITTARTLLETVCKHILDGLSVPYDKADLPKLYGMAAKEMNLSPSQHTEDVFKAILNGCHTVVQNLGTLRNKIGDAHGHGPQPVKPSPRHAALAVNLAGSMATFLVETYLDRRR